MVRNTQNKRSSGRYPALMTVLNRRREVFGLCDRELAERTQSRFGAAKNVSQVYRILRGDSGTRQDFAEQLAQVVDVGRHVARVLIEFDDELVPLQIPDTAPTLKDVDAINAAYHRDEDMFALHGAVKLYEQAMGRPGAEFVRIRADMSLMIGKIVRLHGRHPGFIDDALRFVDDAVDLYLALIDMPGADIPDIDARVVAAELERATIYRRRGHLEMARRTLNVCRTSQIDVLARNPWLDGKCWHGLGDLYEQKSLIDAGNAAGDRWAQMARDAYDRANCAYNVAGAEMTKVDRHAIATDIAMLDVRAGRYQLAIDRLDALDDEGPLAPTVLARLHNRRAWAYMKIGEPLKSQRYVKQAVHAATRAGDPLLMAMAEVLRYELYRDLEMTKKAAMQYEQVLDWVYRDGIRHAEVLIPVAETERAQEGGNARLAWLLKVPWLNAMLSALVVIASFGCTAEEVTSDPVALITGISTSTALSSVIASDPKQPVLSDPKGPAASDPKAPIYSDPKGPAASDPKAPVSSDPKKPVSSDPKKPTSSDPKSPAGSDPKAPASSDPKAPTASDPKDPAGSDPKAPAASDPKSPVDDDDCPKGSDPKKPHNSDPKKTSSDPKKGCDTDDEKGIDAAA